MTHGSSKKNKLYDTASLLERKMITISNGEFQVMLSSRDSREEKKSGEIVIDFTDFEGQFDLWDEKYNIFMYMRKQVVSLDFQKLY